MPITESAVMQNDNNETNKGNLYNLRLFKCKHVWQKSVDLQTALTAEAHKA
jgi:hypothetical protein